MITMASLDWSIPSIIVQELIYKALMEKWRKLQNYGVATKTLNLRNRGHIEVEMNLTKQRYKIKTKQ